MINALGWSFAIVFGAWVAMQLLEVWETWPRETPGDAPELEAPPASHQPH
jgi:hypothetical protein